MQPLKAHVRNGRLVLDEPTDLPEGQVIELVRVDDELPPVERAELREALREGYGQARRGETVTAAEVLADLRALR